jgi:hypothetical protein
LHRSSHDYLAACGRSFHGLDLAGFQQQMDRCFAPLLQATPADRATRPIPELVPVIVLEPPPASWPDPDDFLNEHD